MTSTPERWRPIPQWEGLYEVSDHGRVWSWGRVGPKRNYPAKVLYQTTTKLQRKSWTHIE